MRHTVDSEINNVSTSSSTCEHASGSDSSSIVRVNVNGNIWVGLPDCANQSAKILLADEFLA